MMWNSIEFLSTTGFDQSSTNLEINLGEVMIPLRRSLLRPSTTKVWIFSSGSVRKLAKVEMAVSRPLELVPSWVIFLPCGRNY